MLPFLRVGCRGDSGWLSILPGCPQRGGPSGDSHALPLRVTGEDLDVSISFVATLSPGSSGRGLQRCSLAFSVPHVSFILNVHSVQRLESTKSRIVDSASHAARSQEQSITGFQCRSSQKHFYPQISMRTRISVHLQGRQIMREAGVCALV